MNESNQIWVYGGGRYMLEYPMTEYEKLPLGVYTVKYDGMRGMFYLVKVCDEYTFDYKLYGLESDFIRRVLKTYEVTATGNQGILLNGTKGTGKTVTSKILANKLQQPVIVVSKALDGVEHFLNSIPQNVTIFIDEYEKIYGDSNRMLTIMDGAMNSQYRRMFLLTTNKLYIEDNLKQRPSRIRYLKEFRDLSPDIVEEIVDDVLEYPAHREDCIKFISSLELITVDIVKQVVNEVNIHDESPFIWGEMFNVKKISGKYKISEVDIKGKPTLVMDNATIYPKPDFGNNVIGNWFQVNEAYLGRIAKIINPDTIMVNIFEDDENGNERVIDRVVLKVERSYGVHSYYAYDYDNVGEYGKISSKNDLTGDSKFLKLLSRDGDFEGPLGFEKSVPQSFELKDSSDCEVEAMPMSESPSMSEGAVMPMSKSAEGYDDGDDECCESAG